MAKDSAALDKSENRIRKEGKKRDEGLKEKARDDAILEILTNDVSVLDPPSTITSRYDFPIFLALEFYSH